MSESSSVQPSGCFSSHRLARIVCSCPQVIFRYPRPQFSHIFFPSSRSSTQSVRCPLHITPEVIFLMIPSTFLPATSVLFAFFTRIPYVYEGVSSVTLDIFGKHFFWHQSRNIRSSLVRSPRSLLEYIFSFSMKSKTLLVCAFVSYNNVRLR